MEVATSGESENVTHKIQGLTSGTKYFFSLFALFENISSSGVNYTAATGKSFSNLLKLAEMTNTYYLFVMMLSYNPLISNSFVFLYILAPRVPDEFRSVGQTETNITLQWSKVDAILNYSLVFDGREISVFASADHESVTHAIQDLASGTEYNFSLFALFESIRSGGVNSTAATGKTFCP